MLARPVHIEPSVDITYWQPLIIQGEFRMLCERLPDMTSRITSAIVDVDLDEMTVRTESGRLYRLHGSEGCTESMVYSDLAKWMAANGITADEVEAVSLEDVDLALRVPANKLMV